MSSHQRATVSCRIEDVRQVSPSLLLIQQPTGQYLTPGHKYAKERGSIGKPRVAYPTIKRLLVHMSAL